jgi:N6-adenosine-specific RNA methylase IME4
MKLPEKYTAARKALAACVKVDEVKSFRNKALAMEVYAFQAKDRDLIAESTEIKMRATRRIGELMEEMKKAGQRAKVGRPKKGAASPKLKEQNIDKDLAKIARKLAVIPAKEFEQQVNRAIELATASVSGDKSVIKKARVEQQIEKKKKRTVQNQKLAERLKGLPDKKYGVILADPGWMFESFSEETGEDRSAANHYTTEDTADIRKWPVQKITADACVLYLWATVPMLPDALEVMAAWEFEYKSHFCWDKEISGTGYWNRNAHELLLIGTRGKVVPPAPGDQYDSVFIEEKRGHSVKPEKSYAIIEAYHAGIPKIELNRRGAPRKGWDAWGNEAKVEEPKPALPEVKPAEPEVLSPGVKLDEAPFNKPEAAE